MSGYKPGSAQFGSIGAVFGEKSHTQTVSEMPAHSHSVYDPGHNHYMDQGPYTGGGNYTPPGSDNRYLGNAGTRMNTTGISLYNTGGGQAFNVIQPTRSVLVVIKT